VAKFNEILTGCCEYARGIYTGKKLFGIPEGLFNEALLQGHNINSRDGPLIWPEARRALKAVSVIGYINLWLIK
jgi:hypothetical protein